MPDTLETLAPLWAERFPDECAPCGDGYEFEFELCSAVAGRLCWTEGDHALVIGAVIYHAARRGLTVGTVYSAMLHSASAFCEDATHSKGVAPNDGGAALRATATALLPAYLEATPDA